MRSFSIILSMLVFCGWLMGMGAAEQAKAPVTLDSCTNPIGVFANLNTNCIQYIDPLTQSVSPPLLKGYLGSYGGGLLDVAITPDGQQAIVSNFGDSMIHFIDISGGVGAEPVLLGDAWVGFFAEDLAITPNGKYVLVTDGGLASQIAVIDINARVAVFYKNLGSRDAQAVAISPDGQTVIVADYLGGEIHTLLLDQENGMLTFHSTYNILPSWPTNVSISPDGRTVIIPCAFRSSIPVFDLYAPGYLAFTGWLSLPSYGGQTCVFSPDGSKAYYGANSVQGTWVHVLNVTGPGVVSVSGTSIDISPNRGTGQYFGLETMAIEPGGNYLYYTNPTSFGGVAEVSVVDLNTNTQIMYFQGTGTPSGIAFGCKTQTAE